MLAENKVEVDMVPLIDIISLLLMFLIIVGDTAANADNVEMQLPRADQALKDQTLQSDGRLVIQMAPSEGRYLAIINNRAYELLPGGNQLTLLDYLANPP